MFTFWKRNLPEVLEFHCVKFPQTALISSNQCDPSIYEFSSRACPDPKKNQNYTQRDFLGLRCKFLRDDAIINVPPTSTSPPPPEPHGPVSFSCLGSVLPQEHPRHHQLTGGRSLAWTPRCIIIPPPNPSTVCGFRA